MESDPALFYEINCFLDVLVSLNKKGAFKKWNCVNNQAAQSWDHGLTLLILL